MSDKVSISIFTNKFKEKDGERAPDYRVYLSPKGGDLVEIGALWAREAKDGSTYLSGTLKDGTSITVGDNGGGGGRKSSGKKPASKKAALPF